MFDTAIRGVLFDVGGVLIRTPFEMIDNHGNIPVEWRGPFDLTTDDLFAGVMAGSITEREYWGHRAGELAEVLGHADPLAAMRHVFSAAEADVIRAEVADLARELEAAGLITGILTNDLAKFHGGDWEKDLPSLAAFDVHVDLSHTATLKPHPEAYRLGAAAMGLAAESILFVDDQPVNVAGAAAAGLHTVHFDVVDPARSVTEIRRLTHLEDTA